MISYEKGNEITYKPDSSELATLGYKSEVFEYLDADFKQVIKIKLTSDSTINYWIRSDNDSCEYAYYGLAKIICDNCDGEIDEYNGLAYLSVEYFPVDKENQTINSIRIADDMTKVIIKSKPETELNDCFPFMDHVILNKRK